MSSIQTALSIELEREKDGTLRMLKALPNEHFGWKPHEKSMTLGELANHIVELHNWVAFVFNKEVFDFQTDYIPSNYATKEELIEVLEKGFVESSEVIKNISDDNYSSQWTLKSGEYVIAEMPKSEANRFIITNHLIHHRGQLSVYLRLLDVPLPGLYGPSADEKTGV